MEDKFLIKSEIKGLNFLKKATIISGGIVILDILLNLISKISDSIYYLSYKLDDFFWIIVYCVNFITPICLLLSLIFGMIFLSCRKCQLCITENNIKGKTHWGKEVVLPLYMVSAYSTRKFMWTISISTASGATKFPLIKNYVEIGEVLSKKINERQANTQTETQPNVSANNTLDDLLKLKTLLDMGAITQEEFDAKKKQLLGL